MQDTNTITNLVDPTAHVQKGIDYILHAQPEVMCILVAIFFSYIIRRTPKIRNGWTFPGATIAGMFYYIFVGAQIQGQIFGYNFFRKGGIGAIFAAFGAAAGMYLYDYVLGPLSVKIPILKVFVYQDGNTQFLKKSDLPTEPPKPEPIKVNDEKTTPPTGS